MNYNSYYKKKGQGKNIVLLHGFLESSEVWKQVIEKLQSKFCIVTPDLLGHGKTANVADIHSMEMMAEAVNQILETEKINQCTLVGHSMGGYVALAFAEKFPEKTEAILLMNSTPLSDSDEKKANRDRVAAAVDKEKTFFVRNAVSNLFSEENKILMKDKVEQVIEIAMQTSNQGIKAASLGMKDRPDRTAVLKSLSIAKHFIIGREDALIPYDGLIEIAKLVNASYSVLNGGHMSYIENESEIIQIVNDFVNEI